jgi:hypothetical protein
MQVSEKCGPLVSASLTVGQPGLWAYYPPVITSNAVSFILPTFQPDFTAHHLCFSASFWHLVAFPRLKCSKSSPRSLGRAEKARNQGHKASGAPADKVKPSAKENLPTSRPICIDVRPECAPLSEGADSACTRARPRHD